MLINKKEILEKINGTKIKIDINEFNHIFGECSFVARNIKHFISNVDSEGHTHEVDEGILNYFALEKFSIKDKLKEKIIKSLFNLRGVSVDLDEVDRKSVV